MIDAHRPLKPEQLRGRRGGRLAVKRGRRDSQKLATAGAEVVHTGFRMTALTHDVLNAVGNLSKDGVDPTNREIAEAAGVKDEGQISRLLARLERHGLLQNAGGPTKGGNAWRFTPRGEQIVNASRTTTEETR